MLIPGGTILFKSSETFKHLKSIKLLDKRLEILLVSTPKLYVYITGKLDQELDLEDLEDLEYYYDMFGMDSDNGQLKFVTDVKQIPVAPYSFLINSGGPLYTLAKGIVVSALEKAPLYITERDYYRAISLMTDDELSNLHRYTFELVTSADDIKCDIVCIVTRQYLGPKVFTWYIKYIPLSVENRIPCRIIEGYTDRCLKCARIMYVNFLTDHHCIMCRGR